MRLLERTPARRRRFRDRLAEAAGATSIEYAIMVGFIAFVVIVGVMLLGRATNGNFLKLELP